MWHRLQKLTHDPDGRISVEIEFPEQSQWAEGHFPGDPLIPAVAQLAVVREALSQTGRGPFILTGLKRIKFKARVLPGDRLQLEISPGTAADDSYEYRLLKGRESVGTGFVTGTFN